jgi:hypothetical protein
MGVGGAEELSVDTGTTETPVFDVFGPVDAEVGEMVAGPLLGLESEVGLGVTDGTVELTLGAAEGTKDEALETTLETPDGADGVGVVLDPADGPRDAIVLLTEVP